MIEKMKKPKPKQGRSLSSKKYLQARWDIERVDNVVDTWTESSKKATRICLASPYLTGNIVKRLVENFAGEEADFSLFTDLSENLYVNSNPSSSGHTLLALCKEHPNIKIFNIPGLHAKTGVFWLYDNTCVYTNGSQNATVNGMRVNRLESTIVFKGDQSLKRLYNDELKRFWNFKYRRASRYITLAQKYRADFLELKKSREEINYGAIITKTSASIQKQYPETQEDNRQFLHFNDEIIDIEHRQYMIMTCFERGEQSNIVWLRGGKQDMSVFYKRAIFDTCPQTGKTPRYYGVKFTVVAETGKGFNEVVLSLKLPIRNQKEITFRAKFTGEGLVLSVDDLKKISLIGGPGEFRDKLRKPTKKFQNYLSAIITQHIKMPKNKRLNKNKWDEHLNLPVGTTFLASTRLLKLSGCCHQYLLIEQTN